jgi:hypothetical protein
LIAGWRPKTGEPRTSFAPETTSPKRNKRGQKQTKTPDGYKNFDAGVANKFVIDPHGQLPKAARVGLRLGVHE